MTRMWIADDLPDIPWGDDDAPHLERGSHWTEDEERPPSRATRPIGFMRHKPRVRVKAWSMPIIEGDK